MGKGTGEGILKAVSMSVNIRRDLFFFCKVVID